MHSFVFNFAKLHNHQFAPAHKHNVRLHPTESQLPKRAWFTPEGRHEALPWNDAQTKKAHKLAKRKDAVEGFSMVIQFGNQTDWRDPPTDKFPEGKPKSKSEWPVNPRKAGEAIQIWAAQEFGEENLVSLDFHTDESTPHFHLIVTPIHDGKLQAKHWVNTKFDLAELRARAHAEISKTIPCTYTPGREGGAAHDASLAAGGKNARKPEVGFDPLGKKQIEMLSEENTKLHKELREAKIKIRNAERQAANRATEKLERDRANKAEAEVISLRDVNSKLRKEAYLASLLQPEERAELERRIQHREQVFHTVETVEVARCSGKINDQQAAQHLRDCGDEYVSTYQTEYGSDAVMSLLNEPTQPTKSPLNDAKKTPETPKAEHHRENRDSYDFGSP